MVYWLLGVNSAYSSAVIAVIAVISANDQSVWFLQVITRSSASVFCFFFVVLRSLRITCFPSVVFTYLSM
ncbi:hypothetical protein BDF19DRAFT_440651 [Syncephalis fuscata]|nr:hypothetical protein BDF19DRAFT_440651 [Syncephalis fuscata]